MIKRYSFRNIYRTQDNIELHYSSGFKHIFQHTHDFFEFCIAITDNIVNYIDGKKIALNKNECLFIKPENQHIITAKNDASIILNISFTEDLFKDCWRYLFGTDNITLPQTPIPISSRRLADYQSLLVSFTFESQDKKKFLEKKLALEIILSYMKNMQKDTIEKEFPSWLSNVIIFLKNPANYPELTTLDKVYKLAGYSKPQFDRLFKKFTSKTPLEYLNECKIDEARRLLIETNLSIAHICVLLGFSSTAHFIHLFKKRSGTTPLQFRKNISFEEY